MKATYYNIIILALSIVGIMQAQDISQGSSKNNLDKLLPAALQQLRWPFGRIGLFTVINNQANIQQWKQQYGTYNSKFGKWNKW